MIVNMYQKITIFKDINIAEPPGRICIAYVINRSSKTITN
jgi:hypothetical protein